MVRLKLGEGSWGKEKKRYVRGWYVRLGGGRLGLFSRLLWRYSGAGGAGVRSWVGMMVSLCSRSPVSLLLLPIHQRHQIRFLLWHQDIDVPQDSYSGTTVPQTPTIISHLYPSPPPPCRS